MGAWGTQISSNDTFADVYDEFMELYNEGHDVIEITSKLLISKKELLDAGDDENNFWFAIAKGQWDFKSLDKEVFERVKDIIESQKDIEIWKELGADEKQISQRQKVLEKFLTKLETEKAKPKSRKKKKILNPVFEKGDCLTFKLMNGNYGAAVILEAIYDTPYGFNLVAVTDINMKGKPTLDIISESEILKLNFESWENEERISWFSPILFKKDKDKFEVIGNIVVEKNYDFKITSFGASGDWFIWIIEVASNQFDFGKNKFFGRTKLRKYLTNKPTYKFW